MLHTSQSRIAVIDLQDISELKHQFLCNTYYENRQTLPIVFIMFYQSTEINSKSEPNEDSLKSVGQKLVEAFADIGFAYVINHGVPDHVVRLVLITINFT